MANVLVMADLGCECSHENWILITRKEVVNRGRPRRWGHGRISVALGKNGVMFAVALMAQGNLRKRREQKSNLVLAWKESGFMRTVHLRESKKIFSFNNFTSGFPGCDFFVTSKAE